MKKVTILLLLFLLFLSMVLTAEDLYVVQTLCVYNPGATTAYTEGTPFEAFSYEQIDQEKWPVTGDELKIVTRNSEGYEFLCDYILKNSAVVKMTLHIIEFPENITATWGPEFYTGSSSAVLESMNSYSGIEIDKTVLKPAQIVPLSSIPMGRSDRTSNKVTDKTIIVSFTRDKTRVSVALRKIDSVNH